VRFEEGSVPEGEAFDLTVANLPYIAEGDWSSLQPEVTQWEPRGALLAGPDGLDAIRAVIPRVRAGVLALEVGEGQADAVTSLLGKAGFDAIQTRSDLAGIPRVVWGKR
jgi:release factor glutamine methyltransferase